MGGGVWVRDGEGRGNPWGVFLSTSVEGCGRERWTARHSGLIVCFETVYTEWPTTSVRNVAHAIVSWFFPRPRNFTMRSDGMKFTSNLFYISDFFLYLKNGEYWRIEYMIDQCHQLAVRGVDLLTWKLYDAWWRSEVDSSYYVLAHN